jgi:hypothetical protein
MLAELLFLGARFHDLLPRAISLKNAESYNFHDSRFCEILISRAVKCRENILDAESLFALPEFPAQIC